MVGPDRSNVEARFAGLRQRLDDGGYLESFGLDSIRLVEHLYNDLKKTTESLQKALVEYGKYKKLADELESGVAPFKDENIRLYKENSQLRMSVARALEEAEDKARDPLSRVRDLEAENGDLKLLVSQFAERVKKAEIDSLEKSKRVVKLQEENLGPRITVGSTGQKAMSQCKPSMEVDYFVPDACPQCIRLRNYVEYGKNSDRNPKTIDYVKLADSRIEALQLQLRSFKNSEKEHMALIASLKTRINTRDTEIEKLRDLIRVRPGRDNKANAMSTQVNGNISKNLEAELKTKEMQLQLMQRRNIELEDKLKRSILQEHEDYMLGKLSNQFGGRNFAKLFLEKELDKYPSHDKLTLLEKLYYLERQLSHCCKEKATLQKQIEDCRLNHFSNAQGVSRSESTLFENKTTKGKVGKPCPPKRLVKTLEEPKSRIRISQSQSLHSLRKQNKISGTKASRITASTSEMRVPHTSTVPRHSTKAQPEEMSEEDEIEIDENFYEAETSESETLDGIDDNDDVEDIRRNRGRVVIADGLNEEYSDVDENVLSNKYTSSTKETAQLKKGALKTKIVSNVGANKMQRSRDSSNSKVKSLAGRPGTKASVPRAGSVPQQNKVRRERVLNGNNAGEDEEVNDNNNEIPDYCDDNGNIYEESIEKPTAASDKNQKTDRSALLAQVKAKGARSNESNKGKTASKVKANITAPRGQISKRQQPTATRPAFQDGPQKAKANQRPNVPSKDFFKAKTSFEGDNRSMNIMKRKIKSRGETNKLSGNKDARESDNDDAILDEEFEARDEDFREEEDEEYAKDEEQETEDEDVEELEEFSDQRLRPGQRNIQAVSKKNLKPGKSVDNSRATIGPTNRELKLSSSSQSRKAPSSQKSKPQDEEKADSKLSSNFSRSAENAPHEDEGQSDDENEGLDSTAYYDDDDEEQDRVSDQAYRKTDPSSQLSKMGTNSQKYFDGRDASKSQDVARDSTSPPKIPQGQREMEAGSKNLNKVSHQENNNRAAAKPTHQEFQFPSSTQSRGAPARQRSKMQGQEKTGSKLGSETQSRHEVDADPKNMSKVSRQEALARNKKDSRRDMSLADAQQGLGKDYPSKNAHAEQGRGREPSSQSSTGPANYRTLGGQDQEESKGITNVDEPSLISISEFDASEIEPAVDVQKKKPSQRQEERDGYGVQPHSSTSKDDFNQHLPYDYDKDLRHGGADAFRYDKHSNPQPSRYPSDSRMVEGYGPGLVSEREFNRGGGDGDAVASYGEMSVSEASFSRRGDREGSLGHPAQRSRGPLHGFDDRNMSRRNPAVDPNTRRFPEGNLTFRSVGVNTESRQSELSWMESRNDAQEKRALLEKIAGLQRKLDDVHQESSRHQLKSFELQGDLERTKHMLQVERQERELAATELKRLRDMQSQSTARLLMNSALGSDGSFRGTTPMEMEREIVNLRAALSSLDRDKDEMRVELDRKDERMARLMNEAQKYMDEISQLKLRLKNAELQISHTGESAKEQTREVEFLKKQLESNRRDFEKTIRERDDALKELHKISGAHVKGQMERRSVESELELKSKEADDLRRQVQRYIDEVRRIEELLLDKEEELETILQHYKALTAENNTLEAQRTSLEREAFSIRESVKDAVDMNITFKNQLASQNALVQSLEEEIQRLTQQISHLDNQLESKNEKETMLEADVKASKDLLYRLEIQMDKLKLDLADSDSKRKQLEAENAELNAHITAVEARLQEETERQVQLESMVASSREKDFRLERNTLDISRERDELAEKLTALQQRSESLNAEVSRYRLKSIELQSELDRTRRQLDGEKRERDSTVSELRKLREQLHSTSANKLLNTALGTTGSSSSSRMGGIDSSPHQLSSAGSTFRQNLMADIPEQRGSREQSPSVTGSEVMGVQQFDRSQDMPIATSTTRPKDNEPYAGASGTSNVHSQPKESNLSAGDDEFEAWDSPNK